MFELTYGLAQSGISDGETAALISQLVSPSAGLGGDSAAVSAKAARARATQKDDPCLHGIGGIQRSGLERAHQIVIDTDRHRWPNPCHASPQALPIFFGPHSGHADANGGRFR